jgi:hypothetical protein
VSILECKLSQLPMTYLDLLLGVKFKAKSSWNPILEKN